MVDSKSKKDSPASSKPKVMRMSSEEASSYKEKKKLQSELASQESASEPPRRTREKKPLQPQKANVHLNLSPRLLALAEEFADEEGVPVSKYLVDIIRYVIYAKADSRPQHDRYRTEFVSTNKKTLTSWSPDQEEPEGEVHENARESSGPRDNDSDKRRSGEGSQKPRFDKRKREGKFNRKGRSGDGKQNRSYGSKSSSRGRNSKDKKWGSGGSSSRKSSHGRGRSR